MEELGIYYCRLLLLLLLFFLYNKTCGFGVRRNIRSMEIYLINAGGDRR